MKKVIAVCCMMILMTGCNTKENIQTTNFAMGRDPIVTILWIQETDAHCVPMEFYEAVLADPESAVDYAYGDDELQEALAERCVELLPLDSNDKITEFAYRLHEVFIARNLYGNDCFPVSATHYTNGVWSFTIKETELPEMTLGAAAVVCIAEKDGHIISFFTEP